MSNGFAACTRLILNVQRTCGSPLRPAMQVRLSSLLLYKSSSCGGVLRRGAGPGAVGSIITPSRPNSPCTCAAILCRCSLACLICTYMLDGMVRACMWQKGRYHWTVIRHSFVVPTSMLASTLVRLLHLSLHALYICGFHIINGKGILVVQVQLSLAA